MTRFPSALRALMSSRDMPSSSTSSPSFHSHPVPTFDLPTVFTSIQDGQSQDHLDLTDEDDEGVEQRVQENAAPLSPTTVFLYLLSPYLRLGAFLLPASSLALEHRIPSLACFGLLAIVARHIWTLPIRYLKSYSTEQIILDAFAEGQNNAGRRALLRPFIRIGTGSLRIMLATVYLRNSVVFVQPAHPEHKLIPFRILLTTIATVIIFPLAKAPSLASKRIISSTWLSVAAFTAWLGCIIYSHVMGDLQAQMTSHSSGIPTIAFIFASNSAVALYASLKSSLPSDRTSKKTPKSHSFRILSLLSVAVALFLILPLAFLFPSSPSGPGEKRVLPPLLMPALSALTLLLSIPSVLVLPLPSNPFPSARPQPSLAVRKSFQLLAALLMSLLPNASSRVFFDILLTVVFFTTFALPALIHITIHCFKQPLSIVMPDRTPSLPASAAIHHEDDCESREPLLHPISLLPTCDPLLQRKESSLQRKRLRKRIVVDIAAWILLLPVGLGGIVWMLRRYAGFV